jgi:hypothetical protein
VSISLFKCPDLVTLIEICGLEWLGRVVGMDRGRTVTNLLEDKPEGWE